MATKVTKDTKPFDGPPKAARAKRRSRKQATRETPRWLVSRLRRFARGGPLRGPPAERLSVGYRGAAGAGTIVAGSGQLPSNGGQFGTASSGAG